MANHIYDALNEKNTGYFHKAIRKYGRDKFEWKILVECNTIEELNRLELYYIKMYSTFENGYNLALGGDGSIGYRHSNEIKMKMSGKNNPMYGKCGKDSPWYGSKHSIESKNRISEASKGRRFSKESKQKMSEAHKGRKFSKETKQKMSEAHKGKNNFMYGKTHPEEVKKKISEGNKSKKRSKEVKKKMSESRRGKNNSNAKAVIIDSKYFDLVKEAAEYLGVAPITIRRRLKKQVSGYYYTQNK